MPAVLCKCGAMTNSALSEYWGRPNPSHDVADGCYAKFVNGKYEKGCLFDSTKHTFMKEFAMKMIESSHQQKEDVQYERGD